MDKELIGSEISFVTYRLDNVSVSSIYKQNIYHIIYV